MVLDWNPSTDNVGVTTYDVYRNGSLIGAAPLATYTDTGVGPNASYSYAVRARDRGRQRVRPRAPRCR